MSASGFAKKKEKSVLMSDGVAPRRCLCEISSPSAVQRHPVQSAVGLPQYFEEGRPRE